MLETTLGLTHSHLALGWHLCMQMMYEKTFEFEMQSQRTRQYFVVSQKEGLPKKSPQSRVALGLAYYRIMYLQLKDNGVTVPPLYTEFNLLALKLSEAAIMLYPGVSADTVWKETVSGSSIIVIEKAPP